MQPSHQSFSMRRNSCGLETRKIVVAIWRAQLNLSEPSCTQSLHSAGEVRTDRLAHRISLAADRQAKRVGGQISRAREESRSRSPSHEKHSAIHRVHNSFLSDRKNYSTC